MKRPVVAFVLSFIIPGAGLWYLGMPLRGLLNLVAVIVLGIVLWLVLPLEVTENNFHYFVLCCGAGSGGLAHAVALRMQST